MTHNEKIKWMHDYCAKNNVVLALEGGCGFGRECVGILLDESFPDYAWHDENKDEYIGDDVWAPEDAYHKHPCVAVLGRGVSTEAQLYEWLKWFEDNDFKPELSEADIQPTNFIEAILGRGTEKRMVKVKK